MNLVCSWIDCFSCSSSVVSVSPMIVIYTCVGSNCILAWRDANSCFTISIVVGNEPVTSNIVCILAITLLIFSTSLDVSNVLTVSWREVTVAWKWLALFSIRAMKLVRDVRIISTSVFMRICCIFCRFKCTIWTTCSRVNKTLGSSPKLFSFCFFLIGRPINCLL